MFNDFAHFPKSDRRVIALLAVAAVFALGIAIGAKWGKRGETAGKQPEKTALATAAQGESAEQQPAQTPGNEAQTARTLPLHTFDPNTVDSATLVGFGVSPGKVKTFMNYRRHGKIFRTADDMLDTYYWSEEDLAPLRPYVSIGEQFRSKSRYENSGQQRFSGEERTQENRSANRFQQGENQPPRYQSNKFTEHTLVDINTADTTLLKRIPGIGSGFSRRIVQLRERYGGFSNVEQLLEINNFPEETLSWMTIETPVTKKINLATVDEQTLKKHPCIGYRKGNAIINYQRLYGPISDEQTLRNSHIFSEEELARLLPYLQF